MEEGMKYLATLNHKDNMGNPIGKDVAGYLKSGEEKINICDLIDYLMKEDGTFGNDEKNVATVIQRDIDTVKENPSKYFLGIKMRDDQGNLRIIPEELRVRTAGQGAIFLVDTTLATPLFERYSQNEVDYKGLNLIVTGPETGGSSKQDRSNSKVYKTGLLYLLNKKQNCKN